jgi:catechol 2,3-dioxygenase-like lactoylglutathione lyase family enzyme
MRLRHLGLPVRDLERSLAFYQVYFGFDAASAQEYPDGTVIMRDDDDFDLALHPVEQVPPDPLFLHFGFQLDNAHQVRDKLARLKSDGVEIVETDDEPGYVSFKCLDPDGHRIEVYWEPGDQ